MGLAAYLRLARAGFLLARVGALSIFDNDALPPVMQAGVSGVSSPTSSTASSPAITG